MLRRLFSTFRSRSLPVLGLALGLALPAAAQSRDDGSLYSRFGLGELRSFSTSQAHALGGGGTALWSFNYANASNPATWSRQVLVRAAAGLRLEGLETTDAANNTKRLTNGSLGALQFGIPLKVDQLGVGLSFEPYSRVNYRVQTLGQLVTDPSAQDTSAYRIRYEGTGGLQRLRGGAGYKVSDNLSLGASLDVLFGIIEESQRTTFDTFAFAETNLATSTRLFGLTGTFGVLFMQDGLLNTRDDLSVAATFTLPATLHGKRALTLGESLNRDTLGAQIEGDLKVPLSARFGVAYQADNRWTIVADARYEPWSRFESDLAVPGFRPGTPSRFRDRLRLSAGVEWLPAGTDLLDPYLQRMAYRLGFYYDQAYVTPVAGIDVNTLAVTGGFSLPGLFAGTRLDVNLEVGTRGTTDANLVRDVFYGVSATVNVGERWFVQRKLR